MTFTVCDLNKPVFVLVKQAGSWLSAAGTIVGLTSSVSVTEPFLTQYTVLLTAGPTVSKQDRLVFNDQASANFIAGLLNA